MVSNSLVGSYSGSGIVTQVDKYGNVTCEKSCFVLKIVKTCNKGNVYLAQSIFGDITYSALIVKQSDNDDSLWYGVGEKGSTKYLTFNFVNLTFILFIFLFSQKVVQNHHFYNDELRN
jgi:hypothetical protein